jgi:glyoxylase-like metal-dependent hydrolase (beta-lactamase superfamily II)
VVEVSPGVHQIDSVNPYSYAIVEDDGSLTLVDTGMSKDGKNVLDYIQAKMSKKPSDVRTIVLTHCHVPYVRGAHEIKKATGASVVIHDEDAEYLSGRKKMPPQGGPLACCSGSLSLSWRSPPSRPIRGRRGTRWQGAAGLRPSTRQATRRAASHFTTGKEG